MGATQQTKVIVENYTQLGGGYYALDLTVVISDNFGLDKNDVLKYQGMPLVGPGFVAWWLLQHTRGYKPFQTTIVSRRRILDHF